MPTKITPSRLDSTKDFSSLVTSAFGQANAAFVKANSAFTQANTPSATANLAYAQANAAFNSANSATDSWVRTQANTAYTQANNAYAQANAAFDAANNSTDTWVRTQANNAYSTANAAFTAANNSTDSWVRIQANNAYDKANSAGVFANSAFDTANLKFNTSGGTISGDVSITGNLSVVGNSFITSATQIVANDTLFVMGIGNYVGDVLDIGFAAHYNNGTNAHTGLIRDASVDEWYLFEGYTPEIGANNNIDINHASLSIATLNANLKSTTIAVKGIDLLPYANNAYDKANSGASFANASFVTANASYVSQNTTAAFANGAFITANAAFNAANNATDSWVRNQANNAYDTANAAFTAANSAGGADTWARAQANAAYNKANTGGSGGTLTGYVDAFTGDGSNSAFTLSTTPSDENIIFVSIQGVMQPKTSYSLSGNILTFDSVPPNTAYIEVTTLSGTNIGSSSLIYRAYTGDNTATNFTVTSGVNVNNLLVAENGILQRPTTDYTVSGANVVFTTAPATGVDIQVRELAVTVSSAETLSPFLLMGA